MKRLCLKECRPPCIFSRIDFIVLSIVDGNISYHSKKVSIGKHSLRNEMAHVNVLKNFALALAITEKLNSCNDSVSTDDTIEYESQRRKLEKSLTAAKKSYLIPSLFHCTMNSWMKYQIQMSYHLIMLVTTYFFL